jgi:hypothetical protein
MNSLARLTVFCLCLGTGAAQAQNYPWPVVDQSREIAHAFGQFMGTQGGTRYLHEGLDIPADAGTNVLAVAAARVTGIVWDPAHPADGYIDLTEQARTWRYRHVQPAPGLAVGQQVAAQDVIGQVVAFGGGIAPHLHFELRINGLYDDPLRLLADRVQKSKPKAPIDLRFRTSNGSRYLTSKTCPPASRTVVLADIDMIAQATDGFLNRPPSNTSVHSLYFRILRDGQMLFEERPFRFGNGSRNIGLKIADASTGRDLVPVFYVEDQTSRSTDRDPAASLHGTHDFYYFLTNIGTNRNLIRPADANKYWNTMVELAAGTEWNTDGREAPRHASARFFDAPYTLTVRSHDENDKFSEPAKAEIFINNFDERLAVGDAQRQEQEAFPAGSKVHVFGDGYPPARRYSIHLMAGQNLNDCSDLSGQIVAQVTTDADGRIPTTAITLPAAFEFGPQHPYRLVLDYDADSKFTDLRETHVVDVPSSAFTVAQ